MERQVEVEKIPGNRKRDLVASGGHLYEWNREIVGGSSYRCIKNVACSARLHLLQGGAISKGSHSHGPDFDEIKRRKIMAKGKAMVKENRFTPMNEVMMTVENMAVEAGISAAALGPSSNLKRVINDYRHKTYGSYSLGDNLLDLTIPDDLTKTLDGKRFLLYDNSPSPNRIIIYGTNEALDCLSFCDTWLIDGTFKSCPKQFKQLYSVHGVYNNVTSLPFIYAYLPGKTREKYEELFNVIRNKVTEEPKFIISDFELAAIQACQSVFVASTLQGCLFHLTQNIFKHVQAEADVHKRYNSDSEDGNKVRLAIRSLGALAFLREAEVFQAFTQLRNQFHHTDPIRNIFRYFFETYVGDDWDAVMFPVQFWSVHDRFKENLPRTNNGKEGWHFRFNALLPKSKPPMHISLSMLQREERHTQSECEKIRNGQANGKKKKSLQIDARLRKIMQAREHQSFQDDLKFLEAIQRCLHKFVQGL